jgi:predicted site-specific integrase-resolvase
LGPAATVVMAGHRDRLGRVNTELAAAALSARNRRLVLPGDSEVTGDLVGGTAEVVAWFYAGLCGSRPTRDRALKALGCVQQDIGPRAVKLQTSGGGV